MWLFCLISISPSSFLDSQSYGDHFRYRADYWLIQQEDTDRHKLVTFSPYWNLWLGFYLIQSIIQFIFRSFFFSWNSAWFEAALSAITGALRLTWWGPWRESGWNLQEVRFWLFIKQLLKTIGPCKNATLIWNGVRIFLLVDFHLLVNASLEFATVT